MRTTRVLFSSASGNLTKIKPCLECVHLNTQNKTCWKYPQHDIVMDKPCYLPAITCREDEKKCGMNARDYQQMTSKELQKRTFHDDYSVPVVLLSTTGVFFWTLICVF